MILKRTLLVGGGVVLSVALGLLPGASASAAGEVEVSDDGQSWGTELGEPLLEGVTLIPRGSVSAEFAVRNASGDDAYLRLVLQNVTYTSTALGDALSVSIAVGRDEGTPVPLSSATPCRVLFEGELGTGRARDVVATLSLGDLGGTQGQGENAVFSIGIQLSDDSLGELPPTSCGAPATVIEITPFDSRVATIASVGVMPNTDRLFEEYLLLILIAALLGGLAVQRVADARAERRRQRREEQSQYLEDLA